MGGGEPAALRLLPGAAGAEGRQRLPPLRPPAPRCRPLNPTMRRLLSLKLTVLSLRLLAACGGSSNKENAQTLPPAPALTVPGGEEAPPVSDSGTTGGTTGSTGSTGPSTPSSSSGGSGSAPATP